MNIICKMVYQLFIKGQNEKYYEIHTTLCKTLKLVVDISLRFYCITNNGLGNISSFIKL